MVNVVIVYFDPKYIVYMIEQIKDDFLFHDLF